MCLPQQNLTHVHFHPIERLFSYTCTCMSYCTSISCHFFPRLVTISHVCIQICTCSIGNQRPLVDMHSVLIIVVHTYGGQNEKALEYTTGPQGLSPLARQHGALSQESLTKPNSRGSSPFTARLPLTITLDAVV